MKTNFTSTDNPFSFSNNLLKHFKKTANSFRVGLGILLFFCFGSVGFGQTTLAVGDISIVGFNSNTPDNFTFVCWVPLANNTVIKFTDNGFLSSSASTAANNGRGGENFVTWTNTTGSTIVAGTVIKIENGASASVGTSVQALSGISNSGDQIFAYQGTGAGTSTLTSDFGTNGAVSTFTGTILFGLTFPSSFLLTGPVTSNTSYLPSELNISNGNIVIASSTGGQYTGSRTNQSSIIAYRALVNNSSNWTVTTSSALTTLSTTAFIVAATPIIIGTATTATFTTTYGTASTAQTFTVSGSNLTANLVATALMGFEVSSDGTTYGSTATFTLSSGSASGTLSIRLAATSSVNGIFNSQNIVLSSTGATSVNITTPSSGNSISAKALTITGLSADNKEYDRLNTANLTGTATYSGLVNSESFSITGTPIASFTDALVGDNKPVTVSGYTAPSTNYTVSQPTGLSANIIAKPLTLSGTVVANKVYNGNLTAIISGSTLNGVISPDEVTVIESGTFAVATVGNGIVVTSPSTLSGADAGNYLLTQPTGLSANITVKTLTITGLTANNKVFDGTTAATLSGTASLTGVIVADISNVTLDGTGTGIFAMSNTGMSIPVTVTGFSISGTAIGNYFLAPLILAADITPLGTPVINSVLTASATYGVSVPTYTITATNSPTSFDATGLPAGLSINTTTGEITGTPTSTAGSPFSVIISATNDGGTGMATLVYTINPKALTITSPIVNDKVYDKTNVATISGTLNGVFGSDVVALNGTGTFAQINVGTSLAVTSTSTLSGPDASKYTLTQPTGLTANITAKPLTITGAVASNKVFDGNTSAIITGTLAGVISPDVVTLVGTGTFATSAVGNGIAVTSTATLSGTDAGNYAINPQPTGLSANITSPQFSTGNLVVVNVNSTNLASLIEYSDTGALQQTFSIPSTGTDALTISYTAGSEGALSRSQSGYYLGLVGYRTGTNGSATDRVIARVNSFGTVNAKSVIPNSEGYTANNIRGAVFNDDGSRFWASGTGTGGGVRTNLFEATAGSTQVSTSLTNTRAINIFNNQLYVTSSSGAFQGVSSVGTGLPSNTGNTISILPGFPTASGPSAYGFSINPLNTIIYVADDRATALGGIQKWTLSGSTWALAYTLATGVTNIGARGITVDWSGTNPIIYATTAEASLNRIIKITDTGASSTATTLATASANNIFRGIAFSPILAPTSVSLSVSSNTGTEAGTTAIRRASKSVGQLIFSLT